MLRDERYYPSFKQSPLYVRMLAELDMLKEPSYRGSDDGDGESFNGSPTGSINLVSPFHLIFMGYLSVLFIIISLWWFVSCDFSLWMTCPIPAMMNLCTFMPSSLTQVRQPSGLVLYSSNMLNCVCVIFLLDIGYLLLPFSPSLHVFYQHFTSKLVSSACACCFVPHCSSILYFYHSITFTTFLFFLFPLLPPSLTFPAILLHFSSLLSHSYTLCPSACSFTALYYTCNTSLLPTSCLSAALFNPSPIFQFPMLDVLPDRVADACLPGFWGAAGVCNDHGKTYALYTITVVRRNQDGSEDAWKTYRRYSDFHDFHMRITEQVCVGLNSITPLLHGLK